MFPRNCLFLVSLLITIMTYSCPLLAQQRYGYLAAKGQPLDEATHIRIDGAELLSAQPWSLEIGEHTYEISRPGYYPLTGTVMIKPGNTTTISYNLAVKTPGGVHYFEKIPTMLQKRGRWVSLMPIGVGFEYQKESAKTYQAATKGGLSLSLAQLTLYSPKPYIPLMLGLLPVQLNFREVGDAPGQVGNFFINAGTTHPELAFVRSKIFVGAYWSGWHMLCSLGLQGWIGGRIIPEFSILGGGGWFTQLGLLLGNNFMLDIRYDMDIDKHPGHTLQLELQVNIYGRHRR